jgi:hypothetical protein
MGVNLDDLLDEVDSALGRPKQTVGAGEGRSLDYFLDKAKGYGLRLNSGLRPNAVTKAGRRSFHASGNALDLVGKPEQMLKFAADMERDYGGELDELIHTPLGYSIKRGARSNPIDAGGHKGHVHLAYTGRLRGKSIPKTENYDNLLNEVDSVLQQTDYSDLTSQVDSALGKSSQPAFQPDLEAENADLDAVLNRKPVEMNVAPAVEAGTGILDYKTAESPLNFGEIPKELENDYKAVLNYKKVSDSPEERQKFLEAQNGNFKSSVTDARIDAPKDVPQTAQTVQQLLQQTPQIAQPAQRLVTADANNAPRVPLPDVPLAKTYHQKPTPQQLISEGLGAAYGHNFGEAQRVYQRITGKSLFNQNLSDEEIQQRIDAGYDEKTGKLNRFTFINDPDIQEVVQAFNSKGEQGVAEVVSKRKINVDTAKEQIAAVEQAGKAEAESPENQALMREQGLRQQAKDNVQNSPLISNSPENYEAEYQRLVKTQIAPESENILKGIGTMARLSPTNALGGNSDIVSGLVGGLGSVADLGAGAYRFGATLGIPYAEDAYQQLQRAGKGARILETSMKREGLAADIGNVAGHAAVDVPVLVGMSALPGGAVVALPVVAGFSSAGRGERLPEIAGHAAKGLVYGALFHGASKLQALAEKGALSAILPGAEYNAAIGGRLTPMPKYELVQKVIGQGVKIGTVAGGTFAVEKATGSTNEQAFHAAITNTIFDLVMGAGAGKQITDLAGKVFRMSRGGKVADVTVTPQGEVRLLGNGEIPKETVDAEFNLDKVIDVDLDANGVYRASGDNRESRKLLSGLDETPNAKTDVEPVAPNQPVTESPFTISKQVASTLSPQSPRTAVLITDVEHLDLIPKSQSDKFAPVTTEQGVLLVNKAKAAEQFGLDTNAKISEFVEANGVAALIGKVDDVGTQTSEGVAVRSETADGRELSTSVVTSPETAAAQIETDKAHFGDDVANQEVLPVQEAVERRENETLNETKISEPSPSIPESDVLPTTENAPLSSAQLGQSITQSEMEAFQKRPTLTAERADVAGELNRVPSEKQPFEMTRAEWNALPSESQARFSTKNPEAQPSHSNFHFLKVLSAVRDGKIDRNSELGKQLIKDYPDVKDEFNYVENKARDEQSRAQATDTTPNAAETEQSSSNLNASEIAPKADSQVAPKITKESFSLPFINEEKGIESMRLNKQIEVSFKNSKGDVKTKMVSVKEVQNRLKNKAKVLEKLVDCINA